MTQDYKSRPTPRTENRPRVPCWIWFAAGLSIGLFATGMVWLKLSHGKPPVAAVAPMLERPPAAAPTAAVAGKPAAPPSAATAEAGKSEPAVPAENLPPKPRFDFYKILPEMEVVVSDEEMKKPEPPPPAKEPQTAKSAKEPPAPTKEAQTPKTAAAKRESYILQMGAFKQPADAERLRARLALLGIQTEVQKVTIDNKDDFHRVRSAPYANRDEVNKLRARLDQNQINSMVVKLQP
jgi:cell division protein FtsN